MNFSKDIHLDKLGFRDLFAHEDHLHFLHNHNSEIFKDSIWNQVETNAEDNLNFFSGGRDLQFKSKSQK